MNILLRKEWLSHIRDGRIWAVGVLLLLILGGFFVAAQYEYRQSLAERLQVQTQVRKQWDTQGVKGSHAGGHFGLYAFAPLSALASIEPGIQRYNGHAIWLEPHKRNLARYGEGSEQGPATRLGEMTAGFVLWALVPLLIIGLSFSSVSGEREHGTLRMLHSLGLNTRKLMLAKLLALLGALLLILLPALLLGLGLLGFSIQGDGWVRAALILLALVLYYGMFTALALGASAWLPTSRLTLLVLLAFWLLGVLVAPRLAASTVQTFAPLPTTEAFWKTINTDIANGIGNDGDRETRQKRYEAQLLADYQVKSLEELPVGYPALRRAFNDAYAYKVHDHHFDVLFDQMEGQKNTTLWAAAWGPAHAMRMLTMSLNGTDLAHQRHFENSAEAYRKYFIGLTDKWDMQRTKGLVGGGQAGNADWQSVDKFNYALPPVGYALANSWRELLILAGWLVASVVFLLHASRRLQP